MKKRMGKNGVGAFGPMEVAYAKGEELLEDARAIIEAARGVAYRSVNAALVQRNWLQGKRIAEEELKGEGRAEYGKQVIGALAGKLTEEYGAGFDFGSLYQYARFYRRFQFLESLTPKSGGVLSWTHYAKLLQVKNDEPMRWYLDEAAAETWSMRTLQRNISSQYYEPTLLMRVEEPGVREWYMQEAANEGWSVRTLDRNISISKVENSDLGRNLERRVA